MHGKGQLYLPNGRTEYNGEWRNDEPHGWGISNNFSQKGEPLLWKKYEGEFFKGDMSGRGKVTFSNGGTYEGDFKNGCICGQGRYFAPDGSVLDKNWPFMSIPDFLKTVNPEENSRPAESEAVFRSEPNEVVEEPAAGRLDESEVVGQLGIESKA